MPKVALHWQIIIAMVLGAAIGITLNLTAGSYETEVAFQGGKLQPYGMSSPVAVKPGIFWSADRPDGIQMVVFRAAAEAPLEVKAQRYFVGVVDRPEDANSLKWPEAPGAPGNITPGVNVEVIETTSSPSLDELKKKAPEAYALFQKYGRSWPARSETGPGCWAVCSCGCCRWCRCR